MTSIPLNPQELRRGAFPERGIARGAAFGDEVGAEAELIDFRPVGERAFGGGEVLQIEREGLRGIGAGDFAAADEGAAFAAVAAPFVFFEDDVKAVGLRHFEREDELGALRAAPERIGDFARPELLMREIARIERIPIALAVGEVLDEFGRLRGELGRGLFDLRRAVRVQQRADADFGDGFGVAGDLRQGFGLRQCVVNVREGEERRVERVEWQLGDVAFGLVMHVCTAPEAGTRIGIDAVVDLHAGHGQRFRIRPHTQHGHVVVRFEAELALRCVRQSGAAFEIVVEPQRHRDGDLRREAVIHVRHPTVARGLFFDERVGTIHVVHPAVEVVRGAAMQDRALDARRVALETECAFENLDIAFDPILLVRAAEELMRLPPPALTTDGRHRGLHAIIGTRDIHREIPAH